MKRNKWLLIMLVMVLAFALIAAGCGGSKTQEQPKADSGQPAEDPAVAKFPEKPVTLIVGFNPGGGVDTAARGIQPYLQKALGVPVIVENRPGNNALIASNYVYEAKPDGYTIMCSTNGQALIAKIFKDSWKPAETYMEAFTPIYSWVNADGNGILVKKDAPWQNMDELAAEAKKRTVKIGIAGGIGSTDQVTVLTIKAAYGGDWVIIPHDSSADVVASVLGGHIDCGSGGPGGAAMDPSKIRMLAVSMNKRSSRFPDTPTFEELGKPSCTVHFVIGAVVNKNTPKGIVEKLEKAFDQARSDPEYIEWAKKTDQPIGDKGWNAKEFTDYMIEYTKNTEVIVPDILEMIKQAQEGTKK